MKSKLTNVLLFLIIILLVILCINTSGVDIRYRVQQYINKMQNQKIKEQGQDSYTLELTYIITSIHNPESLDSAECKEMIGKQYTTKTGLKITYKDLTSNMSNIDNYFSINPKKTMRYLPINKDNFQRLKYVEQEQFLKDIMIVAHEAAKEADIDDNRVIGYYSALIQIDWINEHNYVDYENDEEPIVDANALMKKQEDLKEKYGDAPSGYMWDEVGTLLYNPIGTR